MTDALFDPGTAAGEVPDDVTLSARVPRDLRAAVYAAKAQGERTSDTVRRLLTVAVSEPTRNGPALPVDAGRIALALDSAGASRFDAHGLPLSLLLRVELLVEEVRETRDVARRALEREADAGPRRAPADPDSNVGMERPGRTTQRAAVLGVLVRYERIPTTGSLLGMTADEVAEVLEARALDAGEQAPQINGLARRLTDLDKAGAIRPLTTTVDAGGPSLPVLRPSRRGRQSRVYVTTHIGRRWIAELDQEEHEA